MKSADLPLVAIRAFVTIGRHGNFTRAAAALGVTQSAISRHVATLEALTGSRLFDRKGSSISLTPAGLQLYDTVKDAVSTLELAIRQMTQRARAPGRLLVRTSMSSFALMVVVPELGQFASLNPVQVDLITSLLPPQPQDAFDVFITRDLMLADTESWELVHEELVCVGAPAIVHAYRNETPDRWPMIAARSRPDSLAVWAVARGIAADHLEVTAMHDHLFLTIAAAIGGMGFLVAPRLLVRDALRQGSLVLADKMSVPSGSTYAAFVNPQSAVMQDARAFCRWLKGMLREHMLV